TGACAWHPTAARSCAAINRCCCARSLRLASAAAADRAHPPPWSNWRPPISTSSRACASCAHAWRASRTCPPTWSSTTPPCARSRAIARPTSTPWAWSKASARPSSNATVPTSSTPWPNSTARSPARHSATPTASPVLCMSGLSRERAAPGRRRNRAVPIAAQAPPAARHTTARFASRTLPAVPVPRPAATLCALRAAQGFISRVSASVCPRPAATRHAAPHAMHPLSILLLALALSTDAFAAAVAKGAAVLRPRWRDALWTAAVFAIIAGLAPVAGWLAGSTAPVAIRNWDHWIAFILLSLLGAHMLAKAARTADDRDGADSPRISLLAAFLAALATSVDALAVGVGLAFVDVRIAPVAAVIAACTFLAVALGVMAGRALGTMIGRRAEAVGGIILIL